MTLVQRRLLGERESEDSYEDVDRCCGGGGNEDDIDDGGLLGFPGVLFIGFVGAPLSKGRLPILFYHWRDWWWVNCHQTIKFEIHLLANPRRFSGDVSRLALFSSYGFDKDRCVSYTCTGFCIIYGFFARVTCAPSHSQRTLGRQWQHPTPFAVSCAKVPNIRKV